MKNPVRFTAAGSFFLALSAFVVQAFATPSAPDASAQGPQAIATAEYKFGATLDTEVLSFAPTEIWARVFWPKQLQNEPHPILFFLHGNHSTCGSGTNPRIDADCSYTRTGTCPSDMVVTPNHEGYNYLAENLASWGYIVVSINANRGITCGDGQDEDWGLNLPRGRLVLRHLEQWYKWSTTGGAPASLGLAPDTFKGLVDFKNVGLMGHSRGGEGVRAAYNLYLDSGSPWPARIPGLEIKGIYEIGAVDGQAGRVLDADNTAWNQLLPMCDGDVSDLQGRLPFERMIRKQSETRKTPKSLYMVWGANHNFFNTEWQESDSYGCEGHEPIFGTDEISSEKQKKVAIASAGAFFRAHVGKHHDESLAQNFDPSYSVPANVASITRVLLDQVTTYDNSFGLRVEEFDQATGTNSNMQPNSANGITVAHQDNDPPRRAKLNWQNASPQNFLQLNWSKDGSGRDVSALESLDFRVSRQEQHLDDKTSTDFSVQLVDGNGQLSAAVPASRFTEIVGPAHSYVVVYQTVRIPLSEFGAIDKKSIHGVRFVFDRSASGGIYLANIRFSASPDVLMNLQPQIPITPARATLPRLSLAAIATQLGAQMRFPKPREFKAHLIGATRTKPDSLLSSSGKPSVDVTVQAPENFPVEDALPTLVMSGVRFSKARYASGGKTDKMIFSIPQSEYAKLPAQGPMHIQYGRKTATKVWRLPDYEKAKLVK